MILFWLLFLLCTASAWLIGYGMGYLRGARDAVETDVPEGGFGLRRDRSGER